MRINVVAVGRLKEKYFSDAVAEYAKRCSAYCEFSVTEIPPSPPAKSPAEQQGAESAAFIVHGGTIMAALSGLAEHPGDFYRWQAENGGGYTAEVSEKEWKSGGKKRRYYFLLLAATFVAASSLFVYFEVFSHVEGTRIFGEGVEDAKSVAGGGEN